jgi:hypothetical protein
MRVSVALVLLLGFELAFYLLIVQTGLTESYHSDMIALSPVFVGGILGSAVSGYRWWKIEDPVHKILLLLILQSLLSYEYPDYSPVELFLLGISVGGLAPLAIYLYTPANRFQLLLALAIAYVIGTYNFTVNPLDREVYGLIFSLTGLGAALLLIGYKPLKHHYLASPPYRLYLLLMLWIMLDTYLFETISRHAGLMIWRGEYTFVIIGGHLVGLLLAMAFRLEKVHQHRIIAALFILSYAASYLEQPLLLAIVYPVVISYYNVTVFMHLTRVDTAIRLGHLMVFIGWMASGAGLGLALTRWLH